MKLIKKTIPYNKFSAVGYLVFLFIAVLLSLMITLSAIGEDLFPDNLVIKDTYVPGTGLPIGQVVMVDGEAIIVHENEGRGFLAKKEMMLYIGDTLVTRPHGRISIRLDDNSRISMGATTKMILSRVIFDPDNQNRASFIQLGSGKARFRVKKLSHYKNSSFKVKTPTALIGVRGSDFIIQTTLERTEVTTLSDTLLTLISLTALDIPPVLLKDFTWAMVEHGDLPSAVEEITIEAIEALKAEFPIEPVDFFIPQPDNAVTAKNHHEHQSLFSKESARHRLETKTPSFDSTDASEKTFQTKSSTSDKTVPDHRQDDTNQKNPDEVFTKDDSHEKTDKKQFFVLSTESNFTVKQDRFFDESFHIKDKSFEKDQQIWVSSDKLINPEDILYSDLTDTFVDDMSNTIDDDIDDQEEIYEEEQIENINLPWFPRKPEY
ncbi:MAG: FecR domain-containing protein [Candidatus Magnetomorum sp.]|nr:FecR domain-containing protein [Candidatus Magnetomorum sp.]